MTPDVAKIMTDLTTFQDSLATGSPPSSYLSFLVYEEMFSDINKLVLEKDMIMTLFIDDITISSNEKIDNLSKFLSSVNKILNNYGHRLNENKTKYETLNNFPMITGVSISPIGEMKVANNLRHKIINGVDEIKESPNNQSLINSTIGRIITAQQTERDIFIQTLRQLKHYHS